MEIVLADEDVLTLRALLRDYLPELEFEVARTDEHELRHVLVKRQELCERLLNQLSSPSPA